MSIGMILLIVVVLMLIGAIPSWGYSKSWGYGPSGGLGLVQRLSQSQQAISHSKQWNALEALPLPVDGLREAANGRSNVH